MGKTYQSAALAAVHEVALGLAEAGAMAKRRLRGFDALCLTPVEQFSPAEIRALRLRENANQGEKN
jgi:putative transcriptional regulator